MENPIKIDDLGVITPIFGNIQMTETVEVGYTKKRGYTHQPNSVAGFSKKNILSIVRIPVIFRLG